MIQAAYQYDDGTKNFSIVLSNVDLQLPNYKVANATFHLENAVTKYAKPHVSGAATVNNWIVKVADPKNDYLKLIAVAFVQFLKGQGIGDGGIVREGF